MLLALLLGRELLACASTIDWPELKIHAVVVKKICWRITPITGDNYEDEEEARGPKLPQKFLFTGI